MSDKRTSSIILFVLGFILTAIGIDLLTITVSQTATMNYHGFLIPYQETVQPYVGPGVILVLLGFAVMIYGLFGLMAYGLYEMRTNAPT